MLVISSARLRRVICAFAVLRRLEKRCAGGRALKIGNAHSRKHVTKRCHQVLAFAIQASVDDLALCPNYERTAGVVHSSLSITCHELIKVNVGACCEDFVVRR